MLLPISSILGVHFGFWSKRGQKGGTIRGTAAKGPKAILKVSWQFWWFGTLTCPHAKN
jgi:hypothetical protein